MIRRFRNRKLSKDNQRDLAIMLKAICIDDGDAEVGESIIRNMEGGKMDEVAIEVASLCCQLLPSAHTAGSSYYCYRNARTHDFGGQREQPLYEGV